MARQKSIVKNIVMNMFLTASSFIFPLITFPYISRVLGAVGNGKIAFVTSVLSYFTMFASLGIPTYGIRACAKCRDDKEQLSKCVHELLIINMVMTIAAYIVLGCLMFIVPQFQNEKTLFIIMSSSIFLNAMGMEWLYKAVEEYSYITIRSIVAKSISLVLMFLFVRAQDDYVLYGALTILSSSGSYLLNIIGARRIIRLRPYGEYNFSRHIKPIMVFFAGAVATSIYGHMDAVMIGFIHGDFQNGLYSATTKIKGVLLGVTTSLTTVLIPRMSYYVEKRDYENIPQLVEKGLRFAALLAFPIAFYCAFNARDCMIFLAGNEYADAQYAFIFQAVCVLIISFSSVFSNQILIPYGEEMFNLKSMCVGTVVNLILNIILIKKYGATGAAAATFVTEVVVCIMLFFAVKKILNSSLKISFLFQYFIVTIVTTAFAVCFVKMLNISSLFFRLLVTGILNFALYFCFLYVLKEPMSKEIVNVLKVKVKKIMAMCVQIN